MDDFARLAVPAIRADDEASWTLAEAQARAGVGGFLVFRGERETLPARLAALRRAAGGRPLLFYADLERGAGQQVRGLTRLPHLMAIGAARRAERFAEEAGALTAREARAAGIHVIFAPCVDLNTDKRNPIINVRAFGDDPEAVAELGAAWVRGAARHGVLACAKHFPGHGHTSVDSHIALPRLDAERETLEARELVPFRRLAREGVASIMTAHMAVPALTGDATLPVTLSERAIRFVREEMKYDGLVVTDALLMGGITGAFDEAEAGLRALLAGCDVLLCPADPAALAARLRAASVPEARLREALRRIDAAIAAAGAGPPAGEGPAAPAPEGAALAEEIARAALAARPGGDARAFARAERALLVILSADDGEGGGELAAETLRLLPRTRILPFGPDSPGRRFDEILARAGEIARAGGAVAVAVFSKILAWKGASGLAEREATLLARLAEEADAAVISLGSPYILQLAPRGRGLRGCAFSDEACSQRAVARALASSSDDDEAARGSAWPGRFPVALA